MRFLSPLLLAAMLAALHVAHSARPAPGAGTGSEAPLANGTGAAPGANLSFTARRLHADFDMAHWCPDGTTPASNSADTIFRGCNLLGYTPDDIPADITIPFSMVGGLGGGPSHVSYCNLPGPELKYVVKIQIYTDQETHPNLNFIDQITVTWSDGSKTRIGGCDRPGCAVCDCEGAMTRDSDKYVIDLSGDKLVQDYVMAMDGVIADWQAAFNTPGKVNPGDPGRLLGALYMHVVGGQSPTSNQGYQNYANHVGKLYGFEYEKTISSGVVCGITYRSGSKVDAFGLVFYKPVSRVYQHITDTPAQLRPAPVLNVTFTARGACAGGGGYSFGRAPVDVGHSTSVSTSYSLSLAKGFNFGAKGYAQDMILGRGTGDFGLAIEVSEADTNLQVWGETIAQSSLHSYTTRIYVNQVCPTYLNACGVDNATLLQPGDCCQWFTTQSRVREDAAKWTGQLETTFRDITGQESHRVAPTSGTFRVESWASDVNSGYYCQRLPSHLTNCNQLPVWNPAVDSCNANDIPWKSTKFVVNW